MPVPQLRHALSALMPPWLRRPYGHSLTTEGMFTVYDYDSAIMRDGLLARWPTYAPVDALPHIARDRRIHIGPYESTDAQRVRLRQWIDLHQLAGLPLGLMLAVQGYLAPAYPRIRIVTRRGLWYTLEEGTVGRMLQLPDFEPLPPCPYELGPHWPVGAPPAMPAERVRAAGLYQRYFGDPLLWNWDSISNPENANRWWHFWLIVYPPSYPFQAGYDTGWTLDNQLESWGLHEPSGTGDTLKMIIRDTKPAKSRCVAVIFCPSLNDFDPTTLPTLPFTTGFPDGYWGWEVKNVADEWVTTRRLDCRYVFPGANE